MSLSPTVTSKFRLLFSAPSKFAPVATWVTYMYVSASTLKSFDAKNSTVCGTSQFEPVKVNVLFFRLGRWYNSPSGKVISTSTLAVLGKG